MDIVNGALPSAVNRSITLQQPLPSSVLDSDSHLLAVLCVVSQASEALEELRSSLFYPS